MKRSTRQLAGLGACALVLIAAAGWQWGRDAAAAPGTLLPLDPSAISRIELVIGQGAPSHYARRDGHWWRIDGTPTRADDGRLGELADTASAAVLNWRPASDFDPARIGLAAPVAVLTLDGQRLEFGETSVTGPQRYVRVGDRIALISLRYTPRAPASDSHAVNAGMTR
ncbi:hypothetical protein SAMN04487785_11842 [Dyella jiangningensis]|uniref:hypothetical protein n=1 Tax=Dyella sp. AtDHG13 TaxID=1938897 RepID=UPI0008817884|nr:hypothetical protein [Dyella sp. AtDHG13]PXV53290.1 hypothetical protein BDW41_11547 [Dyella sp. AtDHG13]SDL35332.1 hypothetical protein SAMN04487785_11842 [Dyella jiangningensis]